MNTPNLLKSLIAGLAALSLTVAANADILLDWERQYHVNPNSESFTNVTIDDLGNVYAIGKHDNGANFDAIIVKYGAGGALHWAVKFTGAGDQVGEAVAVKPDGTDLYIGFNSGGSRFWIYRLNPANGAMVWNRQFNSGPGKIYERASAVYDSTSGYVHYSFWNGQPGTNASLQHYTYDSAGTIIKSFGLGIQPVDRIFDVAPRPQGGDYVLMGDPNATPPASHVMAFDGAGVYLGDSFLNFATAMGSSPGQGGVLAFAGRYASDKIVVHRMNTLNSALDAGQVDTLTGLTDVRINDVAVGPNGEIYAMGSESVPGKGTEWFLARYAYQTLNREWRSTRPNTVNNEFFRRGSADAFGNVAVLGVRAGATDQLFTKVFDGSTGAMLGQTTTSAPSGASNLFAIASNAGGVFASAGVVQDAGFTAGLLTKTSQNGLKKVAVPLTSYNGGATIACTVSMYASTGANRTVTLSSNSPFAPVPANTVIAANTLNKSFNIASLPTSVNRTIVISATWQGVTRQATFYLKAPRPTSLVINPDSVLAGASTTGTVTMTGKSPAGGTTVNLASDGSEAVVPASVVVPQNGTQQTFQITTTSVVSPVQRTISATANGVTKTDTLLISP